jgi:hypothetical protein
VINHFIGDEQEIESATKWLRIHRQPHSRVLTLWKETAKRRLCFIQGQQNGSLQEILAEWPRYQDANGHVLVNQNAPYNKSKEINILNL